MSQPSMKSEVIAILCKKRRRKNQKAAEAEAVAEAEADVAEVERHLP